MNKPD